MVYKNENELLANGHVQISNGEVKIKNLDVFKEEIVANLVDTLILTPSTPLKEKCCQIAHSAAEELGIFPSSIQSLYDARVKEGLIHFTVPAINLRTLTFDSARAVFRAARKMNAPP